MKQTTLRTRIISKNNNISFPIGTCLTVKKYSEKLDFNGIFNKHKQRGNPLPNLTEALVAYRLSENQSIVKASDWINEPEVLREFLLEAFEQRGLYRTLEIIGENREEIMSDLQDNLFLQYNFPDTNTVFDWTSFILWGDKAELGEYGYSRDHRPDKKQVTVGLAGLASPIDIPIGLTINPGNIPDQSHFKQTFHQVKRKLNEGSLLIFDRGANSKDNTDLVLVSKMKYLTAKTLNTSDDNLIKTFWQHNPKQVKEGIYGFIQEFPSRYNYFMYSEKLEKQQIEAKIRKAERLLEEAKAIQRSIDNHKELPKKFKINNPLVEVSYSYQTKLKDYSEEEAKAIVEKAALNGREGFFCLTSSEKLTLEEALKIYRQKDSIEKIFQSLKNDINIKPLRVWTEKSMYGAIIIGFLAQLIISLIRYDYKELKKTAPKFIKIALSNLTVTIEKLRGRAKREIFSNFDPINTLICVQNKAIT